MKAMYCTLRATLSISATYLSLIAASGQSPVPSPTIAWRALRPDGSAIEASHPVTARGSARVDSAGFADLGGGSLLFEDGEAALLSACRQSHELTIEALIWSGDPRQSGPARIISFSRDHSHRNFTLGQDRDQLVLRLRTPRTGPNGVNPQLTLCAVPLAAPAHIVVTYADGVVTCYRNGEAVFTSERVQGDFSNWESCRIVLGDEFNGERDWRGIVGAAAIYDRCLTPQSAATMFETYRTRLEELAEVDRTSDGRNLAMQTETRAIHPPITDATRSPEDRIQPYATNPSYWQYRGRPVLLLGGSKDDNLFQIPDLEAHLDEMALIGANYIRNTMSDRVDRGYEIYPYKRLENGKYDLQQWNEAYWDRFSRLLRLTSERAIIVQIEVWDRFDYSRDNWLTHPYNPANNVNYTQEQTGLAHEYPKHPGQNEQPFFFTTPEQRNNQPVLAFQRRFVDKMLSYTLQYDHVLYCMDNETSGEEAWSAYWAEYIRKQAEEAEKAVCITEMWDDWDLKADRHRRTLDHPERYDFADVSQNNQKKGQEHWDNFQWVRQHVADQPRPLNTVKTYGADGGRFGDDRDGIERWWRHVVGGAASARFHRPDSGLGLSAKAKASIRAARKLESLIRLWDVQPAQELLHDRTENEAYAAARPGEAYIIYFPNGGSVGLDTSAADGLLDLQWIEIATGDWGPTSSLESGDNVALQAPGDGHWVAAVRSRGDAAGGDRIRGPLRVHPANPRYFSDDGKRAVLLAGSHTWNNLVDMGPTDPPPQFNFHGYLRWLDAYPHNFVRLWAWELTTWDTQGNRDQNAQVQYVAPHPWPRTGPGTARDGKPKFDLSQFNEEYFTRLRERIDAANRLGIYVSVMLFEGWGLQFSPEAWAHHPFHAANNINGIDGDLDDDGRGLGIHSGRNQAVTDVQKAYVKQVIETINAFDNVLYEISNENHPASTAWQADMIRTIKAHEQSLPKQHPVGMTFQYKGGSNDTLFESPADWISPNPDGGYRDDPPAANGEKVIINDTDHLWGIGGNAAWVWKSFLRGMNPIFMDPYDGTVLSRRLSAAELEAIRDAMGHVLEWSRRIPLANMVPEPAAASPGYCLAQPGQEYLVYAPQPGTVLSVDLPKGSYRVAWGDAETGILVQGEPLTSAGGKTTIQPPSERVCLLHLQRTE